MTTATTISKTLTAASGIEYRSSERHSVFFNVSETLGVWGDTIYGEPTGFAKAIVADFEDCRLWYDCDKNEWCHIGLDKDDFMEAVSNIMDLVLSISMAAYFQIRRLTR